jgi:quercetin dioxygenase-like cupin family protein
MAKVIGPADGKMGFLGSIGIRIMLGSEESAGRVALVEHPMSARALAAPLHKHELEDEYSFVLSGHVGAMLGDELVEGGPGDLIFKPRDQWHTFWNASDEPARILEIISPAGFEKYFEELSDRGGSTKLAPPELGELAGRYRLQTKPESIAVLVERFKLRFPGEQLSGGWAG